MSNTGNNNSSESNIYSFDYDEESKRFSAFLNQTLKGSRHPTDLAMMPHLYGKYRKCSQKMEQERDEIEVTEEMEKEEVSLPGDMPTFSLDLRQISNSEGWVGHFLLPNAEDAIELPCYLIGFNDDCTRALVVLAYSERDAEKYYPVFLPADILPQGSAMNAIKLAESMKHVETLMSTFEYAHASVQRSSKELGLKQCELVTKSTLIANHYCDSSMCHGIHNGLVMKGPADRNWYVLNRNIWFEETDVTSNVNVFTLNMKTSKERNVFVVETASKRSDATLAKRIARTKKFQMCSKYTSLNKLRNALALLALKESTVDATTSDSCLQYLLSGSAKLNIIDGSIIPCKSNHYTCACDVVNSDTLSKVTKGIIKKRRNEHKGKKGNVS